MAVIGPATPGLGSNDPAETVSDITSIRGRRDEPVRVLGIETSSRRGTVALADGGRIVAALGYEESGTHSERLLPLIEQVLSDAGWPKSTLDRLAVGTGPGSFTGIRVGLALAQGIGLGLGRPVVGVGALSAMSRGAPPGLPGLRCALVDARRGELFAALHDPSGREIRAAEAISRGNLAGWVAAGTDEPFVILGEIAAGLEDVPTFRSDLTDLPHAQCVALIGAELDVLDAPAEALYVRPPDAIRPTLSRYPVSSGTPT